MKKLVWTQFAIEDGRAPRPPEFYVNAGDRVELYVVPAGTVPTTDVTRTVTETPAWDGEGLPPVGCECEFRIDHINWIRAEVLAHRDGSVIVWTSDGDAYYSSDHRKFRPIRSEEDRVVEEMLLVNEYARDLEDFCHSLYREGYRKTGDA